MHMDPACVSWVGFCMGRIEVIILNQFPLGGDGLGKFQTNTDLPTSITGWSIENIGGFNTADWAGYQYIFD